MVRVLGVPARGDKAILARGNVDAENDRGSSWFRADELVVDLVLRGKNAAVVGSSVEPRDVGISVTARRVVGEVPPALDDLGVVGKGEVVGAEGATRPSGGSAAAGSSTSQSSRRFKSPPAPMHSPSTAIRCTPTKPFVTSRSIEAANGANRPGAAGASFLSPSVRSSGGSRTDSSTTPSCGAIKDSKEVTPAEIFYGRRPPS